MPQVQLPVFPFGSVEINRDLAVRTEGDRVIYYNGHLPVFTHSTSDLAGFRLFTSQLIVQGSATQGHIAKTFGVPLVAIKRSTKIFRERGAAGFFTPKARREGSKLNGEKLEEARLLLLHGQPLPVVSRQTGVLTDTLRKAIRAGRLPAVKKKKPPGPPRLRPQGQSMKQTPPPPQTALLRKARRPVSISRRWTRRPHSSPRRSPA